MNQISKGLQKKLCFSSNPFHKFLGTPLQMHNYYSLYIKELIFAKKII